MIGRNILYQPTFHNRLVRTHGGHHLQMNLNHFFLQSKLCLMKNMKLTKCHKFVVYKISCFAKCEILPKVCEISQSFAKISPHAKRQRSQTTKLCHFVNFMTCPNIILIEKKIIYRFICD